MPRQLSIFAAAVLVTVGLCAAATSSAGGAGGGRRVVFSEYGTESGGRAKGQFVLTGVGVSDSGTTTITASDGVPLLRDGQRYREVGGTAFVYGKKGELTFRWTGVTVELGRGISVEYGTWKVIPGFSTGMYEHWKGGGRWAASVSGHRYTVRWEGAVTG